jgi:hypothetical protein
MPFVAFPVQKRSAMDFAYLFLIALFAALIGGLVAGCSALGARK